MADIIDSQAGDAAWTDTFYSLNRGKVDTELQRLDANHFNVWLPLTGQVAPAHILDQLNRISSPRVADVATGTGVWLRSLAQHLPSDAELFGFDFDAVKFPVSTTSSNVKFKQQDVLQEFPAELQGTFDLVHVRLLLIAMKASDFETATKNLFQLLNPGGWLVWDEVSALSFRSVPPSKAFEEFTRIEILQSIKNGQDPRCVASIKTKRRSNRFCRGPARLPEIFRKVGFQDCETKIWSSWAASEGVQDAARMVSLGIVRPMMTAVVDHGGLETVQTTNDVERLHEALARYLQNGTRVGFDYVQVLAQRPF
ncbi:methyltransferase domain-containing protein [Colletotrichum kahawae]|uniref:Methyltransferase domain-containing protein n=1 Tax=Colletotrichum kahawae TaxID=34407 RepID=A0AAD9YP71_COLKA|nr:methyltransferase domain-containing protein [Colletotrichum kahawae]